MLRTIIKINKEKCNGCGACAVACHEEAIGMIEGKATLLRDDYCDGLGNCLPVCPTGAITFEEREAAAYDEAAVQANMAKKAALSRGTVGQPPATMAGAVPVGCPGSMAKAIERNAVGQTPATLVGAVPVGCPGSMAKAIERNVAGQTPEPGLPASGPSNREAAQPASELRQWPVQIKLVPINAPYFNGAKLLIAADCTAYAYANFHREFIKGRITLIGCPKLDEGDYAEKLTEILKNNAIRDVTIVRMEVPCCGGLENAVKTALQHCGKMLPWQVVTISAEGNILD